MNEFAKNDLQKLTIDDIGIGERLPWDVLDSFGRLLLSEGSIIKDKTHAIEMVDSGMYIEKCLYTKLPSFKKSTTVSNPSADLSDLDSKSPSVLYSINQAVKRLDVILKKIHKFPDARKNILEIVKLIRFAIQLSEDLSLASMQLNHESGSYCVRHCVDTAILAIIVAKTMNKSDQEIQDIAAAALTMNISMIELQERLQTQKEALSDKDKADIHNHPISSIEALYEAGVEDSEWLKYVLLHHEHEDGTGYPVGTVKGEIPQNAKILTLADGFCARITSRGYRKSTLPSIALRDIFIENSAHADPTLAAYFIKVLGLYPPGTFVMLKNKEIAIITQRGDTPSNCMAYSLVRPSGELFIAPIKRDTRVETYKIAEAIYPIDAAVHVNLQQIWGSLASL
jgi:HD-GYP domain-containing protein (c-di-GMP phosphodiesterase class II)